MTGFSALNSFRALDWARRNRMFIISALCLLTSEACVIHSFQMASMPRSSNNNAGKKQNQSMKFNTKLGVAGSSSAGKFEFDSNRRSEKDWKVKKTNPLTGEHFNMQTQNQRQILNGIDATYTRGGGSGSLALSSMSSSTVARLVVFCILTLEFVAQVTNNPAIAISTFLLSVNFWSALAPLASVALKFSPMPTILNIQKNKTVGGLPLLPYSAMMTLTFNLVVYGILIGDKKVFLTHGIGHSFSLFYCLVYIRNCSPSANHLPGTISLHKRTSLAIITFILSTVIFLQKELASKVVGMTSVILSSIMYVGPLSRLRQAISDKSAKDIPLPFALVGLTNALSWFVYGFIKKRDFNLYAPCFIGLVSSVTQVCVHILWGSEDKKRNE